MASLTAAPLASLVKDAQAMQSSLNPTADALKLCGKVVANIVKNGAEPKFRRINLAGKAGAKLTAAPQSVELLKSLGFVDAGDGHLELPAAVAAESLTDAAAQIDVAVATLPAPAPKNPAPIKTYVPPPTLSLKQKALLMEEEKVKAKRELDKQRRAEDLAQFKRDKHARQNDENWTAAAAGVKGGKDIKTYRGQFGEEEGGSG